MFYSFLFNRRDTQLTHTAREGLVAGAAERTCQKLKTVANSLGMIYNMNFLFAIVGIYITITFLFSDPPHLVATD